MVECFEHKSFSSLVFCFWVKPGATQVKPLSGVPFLRSIYTRVQFRIRLECVAKKAEIFCSFEWANLMQKRPLKSDV